MPPPIRRPRRRGQALLLFAIALGALGALAGLVLDGGRLFYEKQRLQTMADAAALGAAHELRRGREGLVSAARHDAGLNGFSPQDDALAVHRPPRSGPHAGDDGFVEVVVERTSPVSFMRLVGARAGRVAARAVAGLARELAPCIVALDPEAPGALTLEPGAHVAADCGVAVASRDPLAIDVPPGACLRAHDLRVSAEALTIDEEACLTPAAGLRSFVADPLAGLPLPDPAGAPAGEATAGPLAEAPPELLELLEADPPADQVVYYWPGRYAETIRVESGAAVFLPGDFFLDGGLAITGGAVFGENVRFVNLDGRIEVAPEAIAALRAPRGSGSLLFVDESSGSQSHRLIPADARAELTGTLYFPAAAVEWAGNPPGLGWTRVIARQIRVVSVDGPQQAANPPDAPVSIGAQVRLVE